MVSFDNHADFGSVYMVDLTPVHVSHMALIRYIGLLTFQLNLRLSFFFFLRFKVSRKPLSRPIRIRAGLIHQGTKLFQHEFYLFTRLEFEFLLKREWMLNYLNQLISDCLWHCTHKYWIPLRKVTRGFSPSSSNRQCCVIERSGCGTTYPIVLITCVSWHGPMGGRNRFDVITKFTSTWLWWIEFFIFVDDNN